MVLDPLSLVVGMLGGKGGTEVTQIQETAVQQTLASAFQPVITVSSPEARVSPIQEPTSEFASGITQEPDATRAGQPTYVTLPSSTGAGYYVTPEKIDSGYGLEGLFSGNTLLILLGLAAVLLFRKR